MKKKEYKKPNVISEKTSGLLPVIAAGVALAGGYAIGRGVKQVFEVREVGIKYPSLNKVVSV